MTNLNDIPTPLNANERLLYAMVVRQNIIIEQLNSIVEHIASKEKVAVTNTKSVEVTQAKVDANKNVASVSVTNESEKPAPRKRTTRKKTEE